MKEEYIINQSLDEKTLLKASGKILLGSRLLIYLIILALIVSVNIFTGFVIDEAVDFSTYIPLLIPFLLIALIWYTTRKTILKNYRKNPRYYNNITLTFSKESIKLEGKDYYNINQWENYIKIKETNKWFLVYATKYQAHIVDKAQIEDFSIDELRTFFSSLGVKIKVSLK